MPNPRPFWSTRRRIRNCWWHLPRVAWPGVGSGWTASQRHQPHPRLRRSLRRLLQWQCAHSLDGRLPLASGGEIIYLGMYGSLDGGSDPAGPRLERNLQSRLQLRAHLERSHSESRRQQRSASTTTTSTFPASPSIPTMPAATRFTSPWKACPISRRKLRRLPHHQTGAHLDGYFVQSALCAGEQPSRSIRKMPAWSTWPPIPASTSLPRLPLAALAIQLLVGLRRRTARRAAVVLSAAPASASTQVLVAGHLWARHLANPALYRGHGP